MPGLSHLCQLRSPSWSFGRLLLLPVVYFLARKSQEKLDTQIRASPVPSATEQELCELLAFTYAERKFGLHQHYFCGPLNRMEQLLQRCFQVSNGSLHWCPGDVLQQKCQYFDLAIKHGDALPLVTNCDQF